MKHPVNFGSWKSTLTRSGGFVMNQKQNGNCFAFFTLVEFQNIIGIRLAFE